MRVDNLRVSQLVPLVFSQHKFESEVILNNSNVHRAIAMYGYNDNCFVSIEGYSNMIRIKYDSKKMKQYQVVEIKKPHGFDNKYSSELTEILPEDKESTKMFKEISMIETKNINRATTMTELLSIRHVTGEYLLQLNGIIVNGFLMDLGSGILGYVSNTVLLNIASKDQLAKIDQLDK